MRYGGHTSCIEVVMSDGHHVVLDAGSGLRAMGVALEPLPKLDIGVRVLPLLLTHRHSDHIIGLQHFVPMAAPYYRVRVACGDVSAATLETFLHHQLSEPLYPTIDGLEDSVDVREFDERNEFVVSAGCRVMALAANHPGGASVLRVDDAHGAVLAYAPDNELALADHDPTVSVWRSALAHSLRDIPLLLHDATYTDDELKKHRGWGHSSAGEATRFAIECNARQMLLMHHHPDRTDDEIDAIVAECQAIAKEARSALVVRAAHDGMRVEISA